MPSGRFVYAASATSWIVTDRLGRAAHRERPVLQLDVGVGRFEQVGGDLLRLVGELARDHRGRRTSRGRRPGRIGAEPVRRVVGVAFDDLDVGDRYADLVGDDLGERRLVALPLRLHAELEDRLAGRVDAQLGRVDHLDAEDVVLLRRPRADRFGEVRDPDAHELALGARRRLLLAQVVVADLVERLAQRGRVVAGVVHEPGRRRVRELLGLDEVLEPHLGRVDAELVRRRLHQSFDEVRRLGDAERAPVRDAARRLVRVRAAALHVRGRIVVAAGDDVEQPGAELRRLRVGVERALVGEHVDAQARGCGLRSSSASSPFMW